MDPHFVSISIILDFNKSLKHESFILSYNLESGYKERISRDNDIYIYYNMIGSWISDHKFQLCTMPMSMSGKLLTNFTFRLSFSRNLKEFGTLLFTLT